MNEQYREDGYLVRRGLVPMELVDALNARFHAVADGGADPTPNMHQETNNK